MSNEGDKIIDADQEDSSNNDHDNDGNYDFKKSLRVNLINKIKIPLEVLKFYMIILNNDQQLLRT